LQLSRGFKISLSVYEVTRLKKDLEEAAHRNSVLETEVSELKTEKGVVEVELDMNFEEALELLNQSFLKVV